MLNWNLSCTLYNDCLSVSVESIYNNRNVKMATGRGLGGWTDGLF